MHSFSYYVGSLSVFLLFIVYCHGRASGSMRGFIGPLVEFHRDGYRLNQAIRMEIVHLSKNGVSQRAIARQLGIHRESVKLWVNRYGVELNVNPHVSSGAPHKTTEEDDFLLACSGD